MKALLRVVLAVVAVLAVVLAVNAVRFGRRQIAVARALPLRRRARVGTELR